MSELVLVTGISGFIAKRIAFELLRRGYRVRGTVRDLARCEPLREALAAAGADVSGLAFVAADLGADAGWAEASEGCAYVQHLAAPFPMAQPRDREALVPAAREGALRVLEAARASGVGRVVLTSSMVAMTYRAGQSGRVVFSEDDWTDVAWRRLSAYIVSKTRAEKAAWEWADEHGWRDRLVTVNPGFVLGPALDDRIGTSLEVIRLMMTGAYPAVPPVHYPVVDVRDLARLHVEAMTAPGAAGRRLIGAGEALSMQEIARLLREAFPAYAKKIPTRVLPGAVVRALALFDRRLRTVVPDLGFVPVADSAYVTEVTGVELRPAAEAALASARSLVDRGIV